MLGCNSEGFINLTASSETIEELCQHISHLLLFFSFTKRNLEIHFALTARELEWEVLI